MKKMFATVLILSCLMGYQTKATAEKTQPAPKQMYVFFVSAERVSATNTRKVIGESFPLPEYSRTAFITFASDKTEAISLCDLFALKTFPPKEDFSKQDCLLVKGLTEKEVLNSFHKK